MTAPVLRLRPGREKSVLRGHPWIFSGALFEPDLAIDSGTTVEIHTQAGESLGFGAFSPESSIRVRLWSRDRAEPIGPDFFKQKIAASLALRASLGLINENSNACRLVYAESDGLPGFIADRYENQLVVQFLSAGAELWRDVLVEIIAEQTGLDQVYERSDVEVRRLEGLAERTGILRGRAPAPDLEIREHGIRFIVDIAGGQKTGFYLDQRDNRARVRALAKDREVLNGFAYTGGFSAAALSGGAASVVAIETSADAVKLGRTNLGLNGFEESDEAWITGDVFVELRRMRDSRQEFDMIVLDPPKFAATRGQAKRAARGYKDINLLAFKLLRPGGLLVTFSCSGGVDADLFRKIVAGAAVDAGVDALVLERLSQSPDHPSALNFPESDYLKGLIVRVS